MTRNGPTYGPPRRLPPFEGVVIHTPAVARLLRMRNEDAVRWLTTHGVQPLPDIGSSYRKWSRAAVERAVQRHAESQPDPPRLPAQGAGPQPQHTKGTR